MNRDQPRGGDGGSAVIPVVQEEPVVGKRTVETSHLRVEKSVSERDVVIDEPLRREEVRIERIAIGREVAGGAAPRTRQDGDTTIVPVLREVAVVVKKLVLVEEIRITRVRSEIRDPQVVTLKSEEVSVERRDTTGAAPAPGHASASRTPRS